MKRISKGISIIMMAAMVFAAEPAAGGNAYAAGASKPARVGGISLHVSGSSSVKLSWKKVKKNLAGYTIYRNGKAVKTVGKSVTSYADKGLAPSTKYTYAVRAYRNVKTKQWFNKKTKKWQAKKPAKKYRGKSRSVKTRLYGKASSAISVKTAAATKKSGSSQPKDPTGTVYGVSVKASQCPYVFDVPGTKCSVCGAGGMVATITYSDGMFRGDQDGVDYSKRCHHHDSFEVIKCNGSDEDRWFVYQSDGKGHEIDKHTGEKLGDQDYRNHIHDGSEEKCISANGTRNIYCRNCKDVLKFPEDWPAQN